MNKRPIERIEVEEVEDAINRAKNRGEKYITRGISFDPKLWAWLEQIRGDAKLSTLICELLYVVKRVWDDRKK